ncbi:hypothetical protein [Phenylobacterium sp.]|uniref:hypothetical protein n=1 Tax=Phenylobacterium sp. TaxID=1871053 RepID=UPI0025F1217C|nr:hypothetical protein [Phenylobacterium sp.]MBX3482251.1 hypothetical protein [Phenylobacterium sp.]
MQVRPLAIGAILFGILAIGGTLDGARRKIAAQPDWVAFNWKSYLRGLAAWLAIGALAIAGGIAAMLL